MGCQSAIAEQIIAQGVHYMENQPTLQDVRSILVLG